MTGVISAQRADHVPGRGDGVRVLTLDNPPVNALSFAFSAELLAAVEAAESRRGA